MSEQPQGPIEHLVVLMLENHSFDHMLGWVPGIGELNPAMSNPATCGDPANPVPVWKGAAPVTHQSPAHSVQDVNEQIFCDAEGDGEPSMDGFVANYSQFPEPANDVMGSYDPEQNYLPALTLLAESFTVCTRWFSSVPGPTGPNRLFANCATSGGYAGGGYLVGDSASGYPYLPGCLGELPSLFDRLTRAGLTWDTFYEQPGFAPELLLEVVQARDPEPDPGLATFMKAARAGSLPNYAFLTPDLNSDSQHPANDVRAGDILIANVYEAVRNGPAWGRTALVVTYDEHGGFFDHVPPPQSVPSPDGAVWKDAPDCLGWDFSGPSFDFMRLGVRVPAVVISPFTPARIDTTPFEHASIPATARNLFGLVEPLTARDGSANSLTDCFALDSPRTDTPTHLPRPAISPEELRQSGGPANKPQPRPL